MYTYRQQGREKEVIWLEQMSYPDVPRPSYCIFYQCLHSNPHGFLLHYLAPESSATFRATLN